MGATMNAQRVRIAGWSTAAALLAAPAIAMQFTREVAWGPEDFLIAAVFICGVGLGLELAARLKRPRDRALLALAVTAGALLAWAELAVGIF